MDVDAAHAPVAQWCLPGEMINNPAGGTRGAPRRNRFTPLYGPTWANSYVPRTSAATEAVGGGKRRKR